MLLIRLIVGRLGRETDLRLLLLCSFEVPQEPGNKQSPQSTRRNTLPVKRIDGSLLMGHKYLACALV